MSLETLDTHRSGLVPLSLGFGFELRSRYDLPEAVFIKQLEERGLLRLRWERLSLGKGDPVSPDGLGRLLITRRTEAGVVSVVAPSEHTLVLVQQELGSATVEIAASSEEAVDHLLDSLSHQLGAVEDAEDEVPLTSWAKADCGTRSARRRIKAPSWDEARPNYEATTAEAIERLMHASAPEAGRLILWNGEPGTGKTTALRALAREWRTWCSTHFITDPETFLGSSTSYLLDVLTSESNARDARTPGWKLLVLEDSGELLTADAHERTGQALSRLLNVTDGLLGQGMQAIVLVTTNEPLGRLHPAVRRPGRCWQQTEFKALPPEPANLWLAEHGSDDRVASPTPLADLFALVRGEAPESPTGVAFGFAA